MAIGSLVLTPTFDGDVTSYTATTTNTTNTVTATTASTTATMTIKANNVTIQSGDSVTWNPGENSVVVSLTEAGYSPKIYTVIVTKS